MIFTNEISSVHIASGMAQRLVLLEAVDRWGKRFFVDADRWMSGRPMLTAYRQDGAPLWKPGKAYQEAQIYCIKNIAKVESTER